MRRANGRRPALMTVTAAIAALAVGCGGDDGGPSEKEFRSQANAVCKEHTETIEKAAGMLLAGGKLPGPREFGRLAQGTIIPEVRMAARELRAIEAPEDRADDYKAYLADLDSTLRRVQADPSLITNPASFRDLNRQAADLGLSQDCNVGPG